MDMLEDTDVSVRIKTIRSLPSLCVSVKEVVARVADVLVQLLQAGTHTHTHTHTHTYCKHTQERKPAENWATILLSITIFWYCVSL